MIIISPTGKGVRKIDTFGSGQYGASRGTRLHQGADFVCEPGQGVVSPIAGRIVREARPYPDGLYSGCLIQSMDCSVKLFYLALDKALIGKDVDQGQQIGIAQDISKRYGDGMMPHIHLEFESVNPELFLASLDRVIV